MAGRRFAGHRTSVQALDRFLDHLELSVEPFAVCRIGRGFRMDTPGARQITLHYVIRGEGEVVADARQPFGPRSIIVVPAGVRHHIEPTTSESITEVDYLDIHCGPSALGLEAHEVGDEAPVVMLCGRLVATYGDALGLFDALDAPVVACFDEPAVRALFDALLGEQSDARPGGRRMVELLMEQALIHLLRRLCEGGAVAWLTALEEPALARVVDAVLKDPSAGHSLDSLAAVAAMSRTTFSERFKHAFGVTPGGFVKETRLQRAAKLLRTTDEPVKAIALDVGFSSRSHFSRAFKERFGREPARFRSDLE